MTNQREKLIEVKNVKQHFNVSGGVVKAVNDISFDIYRGETFGLVGNLVAENQQLEERLSGYMMQLLEKCCSTVKMYMVRNHEQN